MTDNEIKKALEHEIYLAEHANGYYYDNISLKTLKDALDFINRQKTKIEKLNTENMLTLSERNAFRTSFYEVSKQLKHVKSEAIREFAKKVKENLLWDTGYDDKRTFENDIDDIVKEMVGDTE